MRSARILVMAFLVGCLWCTTGCPETACNSDNDCPTGRWCVDQRCVTEEPDDSSSGGTVDPSTSQESSSSLASTSSAVSSASSHGSSTAWSASSGSTSGLSSSLGTSSATSHTSSSVSVTSGVSSSSSDGASTSTQSSSTSVDSSSSPTSQLSSSAPDTSNPPSSSFADSSSSVETSSSSSVEASSSSVPTTSSSKGPEICDNNVDDNGDGAADCMDLECTTYACIPGIPGGWSGPYQLADLAETDTAPACEPLFSGDPYEGHDGPVGDPYGTSDCACACSSPEGHTCPSPTVHIFNDAACSTECTNFTFDHEGAPCIASTCDAVGLMITLSQVQGGSCTPSMHPNTPTWRWTRKAKACPVPLVVQGGCGAAEVCAPQSGSGFESAVCIRKDGDADCPDLNYANKRVYYADALDSRACRDCTCAPPSGICPASVYSSRNNCQGLQGPLHAQRCLDGKSANRFLFYPVTSPLSPCASSVTVDGEVIPDITTAVTFCCTTP